MKVVVTGRVFWEFRIIGFGFREIFGCGGEEMGDR